MANVSKEFLDLPGLQRYDELIKSMLPAYGVCATAADQQVKVVTISDSNWKLRQGAEIFVKFTYTNTYNATAAAPVKINVNNTGAYTVYGAATAAVTGTNTTYFGRANYVNHYIYDGNYWVWQGSSADNNTTYTNVALGQGYGTCTDAASVTARAVTLTSYALTVGGIIAVKFSNAVPANATMNINTRGAKAIYHRGAAIKADVIQAGDIATFIYNGSQYILLAVDRVIQPTVSGTTLILQ